MFEIVVDHKQYEYEDIRFVLDDLLVAKAIYDVSTNGYFLTFTDTEFIFLKNIENIELGTGVYTKAIHEGRFIIRDKLVSISKLVGALIYGCESPKITLHKKI